jgi:hypothetical protein
MKRHSSQHKIVIAVSMIFAFLVASCAPQTPNKAPRAETEQKAPAPFLFVWAGDADEQESDFLAVVDVRPDQPTYAQVVATLPVGATGTMPHHTEYEYPEGHVILANGWKAGHSFLLDVQDPLNPRLAGQFQDLDGYAYPHSFARLASGNVVGTFQSRKGRYAPIGGLVEIDPEGAPVRSASAATPAIDSALTWPYSLVAIPEIDRIVSTSADMGMPPWNEWQWHDTYHAQVWSLSDLELLTSVPFPPAPEGKHHIAPNEPRVLSDGTVYVITFSCGLYRLDGLDGDEPTAVWVYSFPGGEIGEECFVPVVFGDYWIQTVPALPGLIVLDVGDPSKPVEAARLVLEEPYTMPHWLAVDRASGRIVVTGDGMPWVLIVEMDEETGALTIDESFRETGSEVPGISFERASWPHGETGGAVVHGALFRTE